MDQQVILQAEKELGEKYPNSDAARIKNQVAQVAALWRSEDGDDRAFKSFCLEYYIADAALLNATFLRLDQNLEQVFGHALEVQRFLQQPTQLEVGPVYPVDYLFAEYDPFAHIVDDMFRTKIALVVLLNFPLHSLDDCLKNGANWSREQWGETRLVQEFDSRVPAEIRQNINKAYVQADNYIAEYNIFMHHLLDRDGQRLFPDGLKLITHWGLRDELKAQYGNADGLPRQKMIQKVMESIIAQDIPKVVINNDRVDWSPFEDKVFQDGKEVDASPEPDSRYLYLLNVFHAERSSDPYYPHLPTLMKRRFERDREIPETTFREMLVRLLTDPVAKDVAKLIEKRQGRRLQPFDIWYNGFQKRADVDEAALDQIVGQKYPSVASFQSGLPDILMRLGFSAEKADFLANKIVVDPSRGTGHAMGAQRREDKAHLRTRIPEGGINYKGYNIAVHEFGHNVEQVFSLNGMDYVSLYGVPNNAFTEAFAFVFQSRDLELLGLGKPDVDDEHLDALNNYWMTCEIAAVGLVDMDVWQWMYDHPQATPAELKSAVIDISKKVWNTYYAPLLGLRDEILLGVYSHMIAFGLYLPDYSLGHIIMFQIEKYLKDKNLGAEMERMCKLGRLTPDVWMQQAVGSPISVEPLLMSVREAVAALK
ncbi:hypothetical protein A2V82_13275 [candidate division KSB1 bacterium RBG_16_48_16]|nr:MAG: hypothetical protein A2V82_13275 [candidate division KSB1 bacterium RBG_16_48_16]